MRKKIGVLIALLVFIGLPLAAKATSESRNFNIKSCGNIIYRDNSGSIELYAEDIALLQEKLSSVPDKIFDPVIYSHMHVWEYIDINRNTHTRHCAGCGVSYDIISKHEAATIKKCIITYEGNEYPGHEKICKCGYAWREEMYHNMSYSMVDASHHTVSCALDGTDYCGGFTVKESEHVRTAYPTSDKTHQIICDYCGFAGETQECVFIYEGDSGDLTQVQKYCECGNYITEPKETVSGNTTEDKPDEELKAGPPAQEESISGNQAEANMGGKI